MNGKPPKNNSLSAPSKSNDDGICEGDLDALDDFCDQVEFEDISFEKWKDTHNNLDLQVWISLTEEMLRTGGQQTISFVRTTVSACGKFKKKEKINRQIQWQNNRQSLMKLTFKNEGDQAGELKGDLIVHLQSRD